jgi:hypothetical protein
MSDQTLTAAQMAHVAAAIQDPRLLRRLMWRSMSELLHTLVRADIEHDVRPATMLYHVGPEVIDYATELRPMLLLTIAAVLDLAEEEITRRLGQARERVVDEDIDDDKDLTAAYQRLDEALLSDRDEWKRLALAFVATPRVMIHDPAAVAALLMVFDVAMAGETLTATDIEILNDVDNYPARARVLPTLRTRAQPKAQKVAVAA